MVIFGRVQTTFVAMSGRSGHISWTIKYFENENLFSNRDMQKSNYRLSISESMLVNIDHKDHGNMRYNVHHKLFAGSAEENAPAS